MTSPLPPLTIVVTTYEPQEDREATRLQAFDEAVLSWSQHLHYDGEIQLHIADDGSPRAEYVEQIISGSPIKVAGWSRQDRRGVGASLNNGFKTGFGYGDVCAYFVDDWVLDRDLDVTPWIRQLCEDGTIGIVRLGPPHPDTTGTIRALPYGWSIQLDRHHYAFGHRPALYHRRFFEAYGWFDEMCSAWECERLYNERFCRLTGPEIVLALPDFWYPLYPFHVGEIDP